MYHFFITTDQIRENCCHIVGQDVNHIGNVLRMKPGERIAVRDGSSVDYLCEIISISPQEVVAKILEAEENKTELPARLTLFQALPKGDKMEFVIQKAVELGVSEIVPVATKRCVVKLDGKKAEAKVHRWNSIAQSAAKQSGRGIVPEVTKVMSWKEALDCSSNLDIRLLPYELAQDMVKTKKIISGIRAGMHVGIFIGPEGGFERAEAEQAEAAGLLPITLGRRILRTETAGMTVLSILMYQLET
ncbi:MAG: 16S rRNA (uracil(1498)-N(3))-methyltransferase [Clostridiales bacterium]|nr:16S rRNA (uracil(1498)-N(3))-methyltransferase [Clostridiales bacterium]